MTFENLEYKMIVDTNLVTVIDKVSGAVCTRQYDDKKNMRENCASVLREMRGGSGNE